MPYMFFQPASADETNQVAPSSPARNQPATSPATSDQLAPSSPASNHSSDVDLSAPSSPVPDFAPDFRPTYPVVTTYFRYSPEQPLPEALARFLHERNPGVTTCPKGNKSNEHCDRCEPQLVLLFHDPRHQCESVEDTLDGMAAWESEEGQVLRIAVHHAVEATEGVEAADANVSAAASAFEGAWAPRNVE